MARIAEKGKNPSLKGSRTWEYLAAIACSLHNFCIGIVIAWISPTLIKLTAPDSPIAMTTEVASTLIASPSWGQTLAPIISNTMVDVLGRRMTIFLGAIPLLISWIMISVAGDAWVLIIARLLAGLTCGHALCVLPIYLGEIASVNFRGAMSSSINIMFNIGILIAYTTIPYLSIVTTALVFLTIAVIVQITLWLLPESPYYLMMSNRIEHAEVTLKKLRGKHEVSEELDQIRLSVTDDLSQKTDACTSLKNLFTRKKNLKAFIIHCLFVIIYHFGGVSVLIILPHKIFKDIGIFKDAAPITIATTKLVSAVIATLIVDKVGRKPLILLGGIIMGISNFSIGGYFYAKEYMDLDVSDYSVVPVIAAIALVFGFNVGSMSVRFVLLGELFSVDVKAMGVCLMGVFDGVISCILGQMYLIVVESWDMGHSVPFISFGVVVLVGSFSILYLTPETKGKTFSEIQEALSK